MDYSFWERFTGSKFIARGELTPRCGVCKTRVQKQGAPRLFLLPIHQDKDYTPSADYYGMACWPITQTERIPVGLPYVAVGMPRVRGASGTGGGFPAGAGTGDPGEDGSVRVCTAGQPAKQCVRGNSQHSFKGAGIQI